jgi:hypothetical protein
MLSYIYGLFYSSKTTNKSIINDPKIKEIISICTDISKQLKITYDEKKYITLCDSALILLDEYVKFHKLDSNTYESLKSMIIYTCLFIDIVRGHPPENIKIIEDFLKDKIPMLYHDIIWILHNIFDKIEHRNFHINNIRNMIKQSHT